MGMRQADGAWRNFLKRALSPEKVGEWGLLLTRKEREAIRCERR